MLDVHSLELITAGTVKNAWPEFQGGDVQEVQEQLKAQGVTVFLQEPHESIQPGWPELVGTGFEKAIEMITVEQIGVKVVYGPDGFPRDKMFDLRRVFLDIESHGNVARIPKLG
ncbi:hypothetical protein R1flu_028725 [Riccia fluitans]|uniref:Uncharacterized protein n=1 Tax=Riccia fluitans TaxID=41844 RepID=A0ABD1XMM1_9MARC